MSDCANCRALARDLDLTRRELERTRRELEQAKRKLERLRRILLKIAVTAQAFINQAQREALGHKSGVPRGTWSFWKGVDDAARAVLHLVQQAA